MTNSYVYNDDMLQSISHNGFSYNFAYDQFGRPTTTKVGTQVLNTNAYNANGTLQKTTYGNGDMVEPIYDYLDQVIAKKYNGTTRYEWKYGTNGMIGEHIDNVNGVNYHYEYDYADRLFRVYGSDGYKQRNLYDAKGNIYNTLYTFNDNSYIKKYSNNYVYGNDNRLTQVHFNQTAVDLDRTYDTLGRVTQKKYSQWGGTPFFTTSYSFLAGENGDTTGMLSSINNKGETISYTYDNRGNITAINEGSTQKVRYTYDELNQLIREDSVYLNKSVSYTYDVGGNLAAKKEYAYTTGTLGAVTKTTNYTYGDSNWKDKLTAFDGKAVTYDQIGNPLTYDGNSFEWTGRQLDSISGNGNAISYKYNANGIRTEKTVNGVTTKYFIEGDRIVLEKVGNEERAFWYDGNGQAAAFVIYDSTGMHPYYYFRNGQNDVIGLFDASGTIVARYTYDSWGNLLKITDGSGNDKTNDTAFVGYKNPLRYRGYYYDSETKLYYLQSRYYKPEWGRFINADGFVSTGQGLTGTNMFAYCNNNPVMFTDPTGYCSCYGYSPAIMPWSSWERHVLICPTTEHISMPSESMGPPPKETSIIEKGWNTVVGITESVLNGFQASATGGYGWGLGAEAIVYGVPVSVQGKWVTDGYFMIEDGQYMSGNRYGWDISTQIGPFNWTQGYYEPYNVTAGPVPDHINNDITFGFGVCGYLGIGGSLSLEYNISKVWQNSFEVIQEIWG